MFNENDKKGYGNSLIICAFLLLIGVLACGAVLVYNIGSAAISIPDYILISHNSSDGYRFSIDKDRIRNDFFFPEDETLAENAALDSLSLIVTAQPGGVSFEVGSTEENAGGMLHSGGYSLVKTVWQWTDAQISQRYAESMNVAKCISLKRYVRFRADGNRNWIPYIDYEALLNTIGDRIYYNTTLCDALNSLSVSITSNTDSTCKVETWSSFSSPSGYSLESTLLSCGVTLTDTVFLIDSDNILLQNKKYVSLKNYMHYQNTGNGVEALIDKEALLKDLSFVTDSEGAKAVNALSASMEPDSYGAYTVLIYSAASDIDVVNVFYQNGIILQDTSFTVKF